MSDKWNQPPPYGAGGYPPPPSFTYVPAPVMMPAVPMPVYPPPPAPEPSNPTYITNHIYQPPVVVDAVQVAEQPPMHQPNVDPIDWVPTNPHAAHTLSHRAVVAGREGWDNSPLWVIRAHHSGDLIPGKLAVRHRQAYIPHAGREVPVHNFEVLCAPSHLIRWLPSANGQVPPGAIVAGNTHSGEPLYVGRTTYMRSLTPGKIHPSHGCLYISFSGGEVSHKQYEVLCKTTDNMVHPSYLR